MIAISLLALSSVSSAKDENSDSNHENLTAINFSMIFWSNLEDLEAYSFSSKISDFLNSSAVQRIFIYDVRRFPDFPKTIVDFSIVGKKEARRQLIAKSFFIESSFDKFGLNCTFFAPETIDYSSSYAILTQYTFAAVGGICSIFGFLFVLSFDSYFWCNSAKTKKAPKRIAFGKKERAMFWIQQYLRPYLLTLSITMTWIQYSKNENILYNVKRHHHILFFLIIGFSLLLLLVASFLHLKLTLFYKSKLTDQALHEFDIFSQILLNLFLALVDLPVCLAYYFYLNIFQILPISFPQLFFYLASLFFKVLQLFRAINSNSNNTSKNYMFYQLFLSFVEVICTFVACVLLIYKEMMLNSRLENRDIHLLNAGRYCLKTSPDGFGSFQNSPNPINFSCLTILEFAIFVSFLLATCGRILAVLFLSHHGHSLKKTPTSSKISDSTDFSGTPARAHSSLISKKPSPTVTTHSTANF